MYGTATFCLKAEGELTCMFQSVKEVSRIVKYMGINYRGGLGGNSKKGLCRMHRKGILEPLFFLSPLALREPEPATSLLHFNPGVFHKVRQTDK